MTTNYTKLDLVCLAGFVVPRCMGYDALQIGASVYEELSASTFSVLEAVFSYSANEGALLGIH